MKMPSDENQIRACGIETTFDLKGSLLEEKPIGGCESHSGTVCDGRIRYTNQSLIPSNYYPLLSQTDFHRLLSIALSSPVIILLRLSSYPSIGPFILRLVAQGALTYPMFTITLQRHSVDIGGNMGILS